VLKLQRFLGNPGVEKARAEFGRAQDVEERFHHDFDGVDFTMQCSAGNTPFFWRSKARPIALIAKISPV
jgi:hypothetical protein